MEWLIFFLFFGLPIFTATMLVIGIIWRTVDELKALFLFLKLEVFADKKKRRDPISLSEIQSILEKRFRYYNLLNLALKQEFISRVNFFLDSKKFTGMQGLQITKDVKVLIAASAVQLTLGLPPMSFSHFHTIVLYPGFFRLGPHKSRAVGAVRNDGTIVFSLKHFISGYLIDDDAYNVGLHEMAHALKLENAISNSEFNFIEDRTLNEWFRLSSEELKRINRKKSTFLRDYAASNHMEFFAVSIEYFFEKSLEFKKELPDIYQVLVKMLGQDPLLLLRNS